jgi:predicted carbohydrate-binding protein with CBM5 and CBM33 domain
MIISGLLPGVAMRRRFTIPLATVAAVVASLAMMASAEAHGYISTPPSRQALCASGAVPDCGAIVYEPQSVEAPKGSKLCSGGNTRFTVLDDNTRNWPATSVGSSVTFHWTLTARHATSTWQYFIGNTQVASFNDNGAIPGATVAHTVNFGSFTGRQTVLAVWNIADTTNAFYSCVDLQIGAGTSTPTPTPTATPTSTPTTTSTPTPTSTTPTATPTGSTSATTSPAVAEWKTYTAYVVGQIVSYQGLQYKCRQSHTSLPGWEPPNVLALWLPI